MLKKLTIKTIFKVTILALLTSTMSFTINTNEVSASSVTYYSTEITDVLNNPFMGWAPPAKGGPYSQPHSLVYVNVTWKELEPTKGVFNWSGIEIDNKFDYWYTNGKKIILRIVSDYPGSSLHTDIPDWLYNEMSQDGTNYSFSEGQGFSPNYNNYVFGTNHQRMISALAQRYDADPRIAFIQLGSLGHWGEWHTWPWSPFTGVFPGLDIQNEYIQNYLDSFSNKIISVRRPLSIARNNLTGLFNDMFGDQYATNEFISWFNYGYADAQSKNIHPRMSDFWKYAPSTGEFGYGNAAYYLEASTINETLRQVRESHTSWLGPCSPAALAAGCQQQPNLDAMLKTMGYRFVLESITYENQAKQGSNLQINMVWNNKGVAPFYYNWPLELSLSDSNGNIVARNTTSEDIRTWLPGVKNISQSLNIPSDLANGTYSICVSILDPATNNPGVMLAIGNKRNDGRYTLGSLNVGSSYTQYNYSPTTTQTPPPQITDPVHPPVMSPIYVDGANDDWTGYSMLASGESTISGIYSTQDASKLYIMVKGTGMNVSSDFYINSDNNTSTGYRSPNWSASGADYLIENNQLYRYSGTGYNWSWSNIGTASVIKNDVMVEVSVGLNQLSLSEPVTMKIGYERNFTEYVPLAGNPMATAEKPVSLVTIDGNDGDWAGDYCPIGIGIGNAMNLSAVQDKVKLYMLVRGKDLNVLSDFYIDTDCNSSTGYRAGTWVDGGADYLIESNIQYSYNNIYKYNGSGTDWNWTLVGNTVVSRNSSVIEASANLTQLGLAAPQKMKISFSNSSSDFVPTANRYMAVVNPPPGSIIVDGNTQEWEDIAVLATNTGTAQVMKATNHSSRLYIMVNGTGLNVKSSFYLNTDNNTSTGYRAQDFGASGTGCEYLVENNNLYRYTGGGLDWSWQLLGTIGIVKNNNSIEIQIGMSALGLKAGDNIGIGFVQNDSSINRLPAKDRAFPNYKCK